MFTRSNYTVNRHPIVSPTSHHLAKAWVAVSLYCAFHKDANSKVQKPPSQLRFSLPSIILTITSNEPSNIETHKTDRNPPITNHIPCPFEPVKVKFCFLRDTLRWLTAAKNAIVSCLLIFRIRMFVKSGVVIVSNRHFSEYTRWKEVEPWHG